MIIRHICHPFGYLPQMLRSLVRNNLQRSVFSSAKPIQINSVPSPGQYQIGQSQQIINFMQSSNNRYNFNTSNPQKTSLYLIRDACEELIKIDALLLDEICLIFGHNYILRERIKTEQKARENQELILKQITKQVQKHTNNPVSPPDILKHLTLLYEFLSASKVGFLRGDLHSIALFDIHKDISATIKQVQSTQRRQEIQFKQADFCRILQLVTNPINFRLPLKGIYNRKAQSKINLYRRQLLIQEVSSDQSHEKLEELLQSLMKINKMQEADVLRSFILDWLIPLTAALKEEQNRCMGKQLSGSRKIYAELLIKLNAQKLATVALTELVVQTFQKVFKHGSIKNFQIQEYEGIQQKRYISKMMGKIQTQLHFEKQEKIFKQNQRDYDIIIKRQKASKFELAHAPVNQTEDMDLEDKTNLASSHKQKPKNPKHWKSQAFKQQERKSEYKFTPPQHRKKFLEDLLKRIKTYKQGDSQISDKVQTQLGQIVVFLLKELSTIPNKYGFRVPLLISEHQTIKKNEQFISISILRINQYFLTTLIPQLQKSEDMFMHMERCVPMLIEPLPWIDPEIGGYYSQATNFMRYSNCPVQQRITKYADNRRVFQVLNFLSMTPWKINNQVLELIEAVWDEGGLQHYIPKRYSEMINTYITSSKLQTNPQKRKDLLAKIQTLRDEHSAKSDFLLKLNIARSFRKLDYFYYPNNLDFRGRVYPVPPHLNHIGSDLARGMLLLGVGKRLGQSGLKWLKIHCANLMGKDKAPINEKLIFVDQNLEKIHRIAKQPLKESNRQWLQYEDSWQAIATILDLSKALKQDKPEQYVSFMHVHQDGSCNGLQHYAALGRDMEGAYQVNLGPGQKPSDVYTYVSKMVIEMIKKDIRQGSASGRSQQVLNLALRLPDNIKRKTIKQTVMTSVYGVTFIGAREQIYRQLRDQNFLGEEDTYQASVYLAALTLKAIENLFTGAHQIKEWLQKCANIVAKTGNPMGWISPLNLSIVQPYRKYAKSDVIETLTIDLQVPKQIQNIPIDFMKQTSAFPPNFVHSLDSCHMMYTAQVCKERNLTFAAVHDSYWTHAASVDEMNIILRDQFIKLHGEPLLQNLKTSLQSRFPDIKFPPIPPRGNFDLEVIKDSIYFFS